MMDLYQFSRTHDLNRKELKTDKRDTFAIVHPGFHKGHFPFKNDYRGNNCSVYATSPKAFRST